MKKVEKTLNANKVPLHYHLSVIGQDYIEAVSKPCSYLVRIDLVIFL